MGSAVCLDARPSPEEIAERRAASPTEATLDSEVCAALELARRDNVICTPHNAFNSFEGVERKSQHSVQQIIAFLRTGQFLWPARVSS
jgi:D-lactate dehydrogenase